MEYVTDYLGDGKEAKNFVKQFLERRSILVSGSSGSLVVSSSTFTSMTTVPGVKKAKKKPEDTTGSSTSKSANKQPASKQNSMEFTEVKVCKFFRRVFSKIKKKKNCD